MGQLNQDKPLGRYEIDPTIREDTAEHFTGPSKGKSKVPSNVEAGKQTTQAKQHQYRSALSAPQRGFLFNDLEEMLICAALD